VITAKAAATIWRAVETAFHNLRQAGYDADLLTALAAEEVPEIVTEAFRSGKYWKAHTAFFTFHNGRWFIERDTDIAVAVLSELKASTAVEGGQELLRRFATSARSAFARKARPPTSSQNQSLRPLPLESRDLDRAMAASGYKWDGEQYRRESTTVVPEVPSVPGVVALVQQAKFDQPTEELITQMLELADEGLTASDTQGWITATNKARNALGQIVLSLSAKTGLPTEKQFDARKQLTKAGITTPEQETRVYLIYKAVCETDHKITSRHDAVLDVAICLVTAEFLLRRYLERSRT